MTGKKVEKSIRQASAHLSPYRIVLILAVVVFISESIIMVLISFLPPQPTLLEAFIDSFALVALLSPALYFLLFKPILLDIKERRLLEDCVRKKEAKNRSILEAIPEMLFILDTEGVFTGFKAMKGIEPAMPPQDFISKKISDVLPELAEETLKHIELAFRNGTTQLFEYELPLKGIKHNYEAKISRISEDEVLCIVRDITERKRAEEALKESEEKYRRIVETSTEGIWMLDASSKTSYVNSRMAQMLGYTGEEMLGKQLFDFMDADARIEAKKCLERRKHGIKEILDFRFSRKDGTNLWTIVSTNPIFDDKGQYVGALGMITDISERKQVEEKIYAAKTLLEKTFASLDVVVFVVDPATRTIMDCNPAIERVFGYSKDEVTGRNTEFLYVDRTEYEHFGKRLFTALDESGLFNTEFRMKRKDGGIFFTENTVTQVADEKGQRIYVISVVRDITQRKLVEEKIEASLKEKEILLREIHHRVKNNMQIISSLLGLTSGTIQEKKYIEMFRESQNRINSMSLIHEKLYRSKDLTKIDFKEYIRELVNSLFKSHRITGTIELKINIENVSLGTDNAIHCGLIINELITNSIKYAFPGDRKGEIKISLRFNDENMNELVVSDNGVGIPEDVDFRKTESLGLRLVTILVENQLNGKIDMDRSNGTEFKIKFQGG